MILSRPCPLEPSHNLDGFDCGEPDLDVWLKRRALTNQSSGASRTFVVLDDREIVRGYYALAAGAVASRNALGAVRRNMPDPIPVMVLGRLAIDRAAQGSGLGALLLRDAVLRTVTVAENVGIRALLVHALHEKAQAFYLKHGFQPSPVDPLTLMLRLPGLK